MNQLDGVQFTPFREQIVAFALLFFVVSFVVEVSESTWPKQNM